MNGKAEKAMGFPENYDWGGGTQSYDDDEDGKKSGGGGGGECYVVSATFGRSRELCQVHRRCRYIFALNPLMVCGWVLYKFYGPKLARWSQTSPTRNRIARTLLSRPIVAATSLNPVKALPAMLWLMLLSLVGLVLIVPASIAALCWHSHH